jgi:hypothetical protein
MKPHAAFLPGEFQDGFCFSYFSDLVPDPGGNGIRWKDRSLTWSTTRKFGCFFPKRVPAGHEKHRNREQTQRARARERSNPAELLWSFPPVIYPGEAREKGATVLKMC